MSHFLHDTDDDGQRRRRTTTDNDDAKVIAILRVFYENSRANKINQLTHSHTITPFDGSGKEAF